MRRLAAQAQAEAAAARQRRAAAEAERQRTGKKRRGTAPPPVAARPDDQAQRNVPEPELRRMRTNNQGWEYCGHAQASVDGACQSLVAGDVTEASNDTQPAEPLAQATLAPRTQAGRARPQAEAGAVPAIPATLDHGYDSAVAGAALETLGVEPSRASGRQRPHVPEAEAPRRLPQCKSAWQRTCGRLQAGHGTPDARGSWNRCLASSKKRVVSAASCCVAWRPSGAHGVWSA